MSRISPGSPLTLEVDSMQSGDSGQRRYGDDRFSPLRCARSPSIGPLSALTGTDRCTGGSNPACSSQLWRKAPARPRHLPAKRATFGDDAFTGNLYVPRASARLNRGWVSVLKVTCPFWMGCHKARHRLGRRRNLISGLEWSPDFFFLGHPVRLAEITSLALAPRLGAIPYGTRRT